MKNKSKLLYFLYFMHIFNIGCEDDVVEEEAVDNTIETPTVYEFESRFAEGESSVSYSGQVVRNLLINDIKTQCGTDAGTGDASVLLSVMANDNASRSILTAPLGGTALQTLYHDISSSHLNDRLNAVSDYVLPGYDSNAGTAISGWVTDLVNNGKTNADGIRLDQMIQKTLWGAVSYWQATSKYMSKIPDDDNSVSDDGDPYTAMEHHWDESFGYFGAARDYNTSYDDNTRKSGPSVDSNGDGSIDFKTEYNVGWAVTAAKRDLVDGVSVDYDLTKTVMDAYLEGRTLIYNQAPLEDILAQRTIVLNTFEKVVAAVTIHYINDTSVDIAALIQAGDANITAGSDATGDYENHWAEMRGYANGLLYNDFKVIDDVNLNRVYTVMGTAPVYPDGDFDELQTYHDALVGEVREIFQVSYGFDDEHMTNW